MVTASRKGFANISVKATFAPGAIPLCFGVPESNVLRPKSIAEPRIDPTTWKKSKTNAK
jgi:hypothetical protein